MSTKAGYDPDDAAIPASLYSTVFLVRSPTFLYEFISEK